MPDVPTLVTAGGVPSPSQLLRELPGVHTEYVAAVCARHNGGARDCEQGGILGTVVAE